MGIKITKKNDPAREVYGLTVNDLKAFVAEAERAGVDLDTPVSDCQVTFRSKLKQIAVEGS